MKNARHNRIDPSTPATIYAVTGGSVFKSRDGGESRTAINAGLTDQFVEALAIDRNLDFHSGTCGVNKDQSHTPARRPE